MLNDWQNAAVATKASETIVIITFHQKKATKPFSITIRTRITQLPERGTGVASATTVDTPPWSDDKK